MKKNKNIINQLQNILLNICNFILQALILLNSFLLSIQKSRDINFFIKYCAIKIIQDYRYKSSVYIKNKIVHKFPLLNNNYTHILIEIIIEFIIFIILII